MLTYNTREHDVLDDIVWRHYGVLNPSTLRQVLEANRGLAGRGSVLAAGVLVNLPVVVQPAGAKMGVALWD